MVVAISQDNTWHMGRHAENAVKLATLRVMCRSRTARAMNEVEHEAVQDSVEENNIDSVSIVICITSVISVAQTCTLSRGTSQSRKQAELRSATQTWTTFQNQMLW